MADNYLEKRFEEHLNAPYQKEVRKYQPVKQRRALVVCGASILGAAIVRALRVAGNKVAVFDYAKEICKTVALKNGAECLTEVPWVPKGLSTLMDKWGGVDIVVNVMPCFEKWTFPLFDGVSDPVFDDPNFHRGSSEYSTPPDDNKLLFERANAIIEELTNWTEERQEPNNAHIKMVNVAFRFLEDDAENLTKTALTLNGWLPMDEVEYKTCQLAHAIHKIGGTFNTIYPKMVYLGENWQDGTNRPRCVRPQDVARMVRFMTDDANDCLTAEVYNMGYHTGEDWDILERSLQGK